MENLSLLKDIMLGTIDLPTIDFLLPTGLPTGLQPDCLHGLHTTLCYVLVLPLSSFS